MPSAIPTVSRRRVLAGAAALALLSGSMTTACGSTPPVKDVDALIGALDRARADSRLAGDAAAAASPPAAATLSAVADQRAAHAKALTEEITRISGETPTTSTTASASASASATASSSTAPTSSSPPPKPPTAADVVAALKQSADGASLLATQQSGYRAGLLGSIAAACTAAATVALAGTGVTT